MDGELRADYYGCPALHQLPEADSAIAMLGMRRVIRAKHLGAADLGDLSGLENPAAIEEIARAL